MRSQHTEGIDVISRSGKSNRKFTSRTNIDWSWFGKVRVYFWQCLHRSLVTRVSPNLRQYVSSHVAHFGKKTTTHGPLVSVLTYSLLKDCIKNCHSFCYVFVPTTRLHKLVKRNHAVTIDIHFLQNKHIINTAQREY